MSISDERFAELVEYYDQLKQAIIRVDNKYGVDYVEPELDFPPTLGLQPLEFVAKTEQELRQQAYTNVQPALVAKRAREEENYQSGKDGIAARVRQLELDHQKKLDNLLEAYNTATAKLYYKLVNHGLLYSSINTDQTNKQRQHYTDSVQSENADYEDKQMALTVQLDKLNAQYEYNMQALDEEQEAREEVEYRQLLDQQDKQKLSIDKYNQGLVEKENKYQASCQRSIQYARQAEYERALEASKLYAELGESGIKQMTTSEKLTVAKVYFTPLTNEEAHCLLDMDSFLITHLGTSYSAFTDWVDVTLS